MNLEVVLPRLHSGSLMDVEKSQKSMGFFLKKMEDFQICSLFKKKMSHNLSIFSTMNGKNLINPWGCHGDPVFFDGTIATCKVRSLSWRWSMVKTPVSRGVLVPQFAMAPNVPFR